MGLRQKMFGTTSISLAFFSSVIPDSRQVTNIHIGPQLWIYISNECESL